MEEEEEEEEVGTHPLVGGARPEPPGMITGGTQLQPRRRSQARVSLPGATTGNSSLPVQVSCPANFDALTQLVLA